MFKRNRHKHVVHKVASGPLDLEKELNKIYATADGTLPDLSTIERARGRRWPWLVSSLLLVLCLIGGGVWYGRGYLQAQNFNQATAIQISIDGPIAVATGEEKSFTINWHNTTAQPLHHVIVQIDSPSDFTWLEANPIPTDANLHRFDLGELPARAHGKIHVRGWFLGSLGSQTSLQARSSYQLNEAAPWQDTSVLLNITYKGTMLAGNVLGADQVKAGEPVTVRYVLANLGTQPVSDLWARIIYPAGFLPTISTSTDVDVLTRQIRARVGTLSPRAFLSVPISGSFISGFDGEAVFESTIGRPQFDGSFAAASRSEKRLVVSSGDLVLRLLANGTSADQVIVPGEALRVSLAYDYSGKQIVNDSQIKLVTETIIDGRSVTGTTLLDWSKWNGFGRGTTSTRVRTPFIVYDNSRLPELKEIRKGSRNVFESVWPTRLATSGTKDVLITLWAEVQAKQRGAQVSWRTQPISIRYLSDIKLQVEPRYFSEEGAPLGTGPLPPQVGKATRYRVFWRLSKTLHEIEQLNISVPLPRIVGWANNVSVPLGSLSYDERSRVIRWRIERIPDGSQELEAWFDIEVTPTAADVGRFADLLQSTSFDAKDVQTTTLISRTLPAWNTDLEHDESARGKGVVRRAE